MDIPASIPATTEKKMAALEKWMAPIFAKFPHLPESARQTIAGIAPWLALIFGILGILALLGAGAVVSLLAVPSIILGAAGLKPIFLFVSLLASLIACVLELFAFSPLRERLKKGWNFLFYGIVLTTAATILAMAFGGGSLGALVGALIGFWLLFEVRGLYH